MGRRRVSYPLSLSLLSLCLALAISNTAHASTLALCSAGFNNNFGTLKDVWKWQRAVANEGGSSFGSTKPTGMTKEELEAR